MVILEYQSNGNTLYKPCDSRGVAVQVADALAAEHGPAFSFTSIREADYTMLMDRAAYERRRDAVGVTPST